MQQVYKILRILFFIVCTISYSQAEELKIFYVDIDKIMKESNVGKKVNKNLDSLIKKKSKEFKKIKENLKKKKEKLVKKKNILSKDELTKK